MVGLKYKKCLERLDKIYFIFKLNDFFVYVLNFWALYVQQSIYVSGNPPHIII